MTSWDAFFTAEVGASAALTGLLFVGMSINLNRILSLPAIANRAFQSLILLLGVLAIASLLLVPGESYADYGWEILAVAIPLWLGVNALEVRSWRRVQSSQRHYLGAHTFELQVPMILFLVAGALFVGNSDTAPYWLVPATVIAFIITVVEAWVITVEINR